MNYMWPFSNKEPAESAIDLIHDLRTWREIGQEFSYLGRTCVVTGYYAQDIDGWSSGIQANYADDHGVIRGLSFSGQESRALMLSNMQ